MNQENRKLARPSAPAFIAFMLAVTMLLMSACSGLPIALERGISRTHAAAPKLAKMVPQESPSNENQPIAGISATQPADGSTDVDPYTQILVVFDRPVVPLTSVDDQENLPQPLTVEPNTPGQGRWVSTSVYSFQPQESLLGAAGYTVTVDQPSPASGGEAGEPVVFTFTTAAPIVVDAFPTGDQVRPDSAVRVEFSQPMDAESAAGAFSLTPLDQEGAAAVDGQITWDEARRTLTFTPTMALDFGANYTVAVSDSALAAGSSGGLREPFASQFSVAPYPDILSTTPYDGETGVSPDTTVSIMFNTAMSSTLLMDQVTVSPMISTTTVYSYYSPYNNELILSWFKQPQTEYSITVGGEAEDDFGNTLGEDRQFSFTTGDYSPFVNLELDWFTHFTAGDEARAGVLYRNVDQLDVDLYALPQNEALRLAAMFEWQIPQDYVAPDAGVNTVWSRTYDTSGDTNVSIRQIITLTNEAGDELIPGAYFMQVEAPGILDTDGNALRDQAAILITDTNLVVKKSINGPSLAWLTDLISGEPVADAPVSFYFDGEQIGSARTGDDGVAILGLDIPSDSSWLPVIAAAGEAGNDNYGMASSGWNSGIAPWEFGLSSGWSVGPLVGNFYTDRPIYRPGDTVNWKGIIRVLDGGSYELPPAGLPISVTIRNDIGTTVSQVVVTPNDMGTVNGSTTLSSEAGTGYYYLDATLDPAQANGNSTGVGFQVAEYRKPEFELSVQSAQPEYIHGDTVRIDVDASYFSGSPLADAPLTWRLIADPYTFSWSDEDGRWYSFSPYDPESDTYDPYRGIFSLGLVNEGSGVTAADGSYTIEVPADLSQSLSSQNWAFDVTVQSGTNQFVTGRVSVPVHRAQFYIGLSPSSYVVNAGEEASVDIVTLTPQAEAYPGAEIELVVYDFNWNSVYEQAADGTYRWETSVERTPVYTDTATTNHDGRAVLTWPTSKAGQYQVVASAKDDAGNPTTSAAFVWVSAASDGEYVSWPMENNDRIEIVADKTKYAPGDVARILVPSPFQGNTTALVTEEQTGVLNAEVRTLTANSEMLEIPITEQHIPNVYVSVLLVKGVDETNPYPAMRIGYVMLPVDT
ncbi:MAG: Ig-like domain-containing protein, partial [Caldilineaceae bacterium]